MYNMKKLLPILILTLSLMTSLNTRAQVKHWTGTWATAPEYTGPSDMPVSTLSNHSLRQVVRVSVGGDVVRLKLSNEFGNSPIRSEEHTSELSHQIISYAVFCLKKKKNFQCFYGDNGCGCCTLYSCSSV